MNRALAPLLALLVGCGSSDSSPAPATPGTGGSGGAHAGGGSSAAGSRAGGSGVGGSSTPGGSPSAGGSSTTGGSPSAGGSAGAPVGSGGAAGAPASACDDFGRYGVPTTTFTLPVPSDGHFNHEDIQADFPDVDWAHLDRLYLPAGVYKSLDIGNLPKRDLAKPLVITNLGGQVKIGPPDPGANFVWSIGGGSGWILTGRYDETSKTGDASAPGHRCGDYAHAAGRYGIWSDDEYVHSQYSHMGIAVANATDFEIEMVEVERSSFAGIRLLNSRKQGDPAQPMANVSVHDTYVHDTDGEGYYFGWTGDPPANLFPNLKIYNNRVLRTGNEALQIQDLGDGTEVHHNVFAWASLHWRDNGLGAYQDNNDQELVRTGTISIHDNAFIGGASNLVNFFCSPEAADGDGPVNVTFEHNYFADTLSLTAFLNGNSAPPSTFTFHGNTFTGLAFGYDELDPNAHDPGVLFDHAPAFTGAIAFTANQIDLGTKKLTYGIDLNGTSGITTASDNVGGAAPRFTFVQSDDYDADPKAHLEAWAPVATLSPGMPAITYQPGDRVSYLGDLYQCTKASTNETPADHPGSWTKLAAPIDDVRAPAGSPYAGIGVQ